MKSANDVKGKFNGIASSDIRAVAFDIGDTLIFTPETMKACAEIAADSLVRYGVDVKRDDLIDEFFRADATTHYPDLNHFFSDMRVVVKACRSTALAADRALSTETIAAAFLAVYRMELRRRIVPDPAVTSLLDRLRKRGLKIGALSNGTLIEQIEVLVRMDIFDYFDAVLISEEFGAEKPDLSIFNRMASLLEEENRHIERYSCVLNVKEGLL